MRELLFRTVIATAAFSLTVAVALCAMLLSYRESVSYYLAPPSQERLFDVQSIDTMKYSRDMAGQILDDPGGFKPMIDRQMTFIAEAGATHAAIGTPYDARLLPVLRLWVASARAHRISVWFRGNFSGWEGWFEYPEIGPDDHARLLKQFLRDNPDLFENGDVFTPCPECENGGPGDPRQTGDIDGYNAFLVREKDIAAAEFARQGKRISVYPSMNADVARQIITSQTVRAFGGTVLIDHYVRTPEQFASDMRAIPRQLNARVGLGEFGAPIPDLNGDLTQAQQAKYVDALFAALYKERAHVPLVNYWVLSGGSTTLLNDNGTPRAAYAVVRNYFKAFNVYGVIYNSLGENVSEARVSIDGSGYATISNGPYQLFVPRQYKNVTITADGYVPMTFSMPASATTTVVEQDARLEPLDPNWWYRMRAYLYKKFRLSNQERIL